MIALQAISFTFWTFESTRYSKEWPHGPALLLFNDFLKHAPFCDW